MGGNGRALPRNKTVNYWCRGFPRYFARNCRRVKFVCARIRANLSSSPISSRRTSTGLRLAFCFGDQRKRGRSSFSFAKSIAIRRDTYGVAEN